MPTDKLYFDERLIGEVEYSDADFPSFCGKFHFRMDQADDLSKHILSYIDFSMRQDRYYVSQDQVVEYTPKENELEELQKEEERYVDLIETNSWTLVEENGEVTKVLIPLFSFDGTITWRLNTAN